MTTTFASKAQGMLATHDLPSTGEQAPSGRRAMHSWALGVALAAVSCLTSCDRMSRAIGSTEPDEPEAAHAHDDEELPSGRIAVPDTVIHNLGLTFIDVERRKIESTVRVAGEFEVLPSARREVRSFLAGRVEVLVRQYDDVTAGDLLLRVTSPDWNQLQRDHAHTLSEILRLEASIAAFDRLESSHHEHEVKLQESLDVLEARTVQLEELGDAGGGRIIELGDARATLASVRALFAATREKGAELEASKTTKTVELAGLRAKAKLTLRSMASVTGIDPETLTGDGADGDPLWLSMADIEVRAKSSGVVESVPTTDGAWIDAGDLVLTTIDPAALRFRAAGLQSDLGSYMSGAPALIVPPSATKASRSIDMESTMSGTLVFGLEADPKSRTVDLLVSPTDLRSWARPGVAGLLEIVVESSETAELSIPTPCVQRDGTTSVFFKRASDDPDVVIRVDADLGLSDGRWVAVLSGLGEGDEVVLDGAFELMLATSGTRQSGGHFHADGTFHEDDH